MKQVRAKKHLGQHFLEDLNIAREIAVSLPSNPLQVLEVGSGMGVLTRFLIERPGIDLKVIEIDTESVRYLHASFPHLGERVIEGDFLQVDVNTIFPGQFSIIGNFPYNISSQIFFKAYHARDKVSSLVGMVQHEVGRRIVSGPGSKEYGILSVLLQSFFDARYLFAVEREVFNPPPKVRSAVIRLERNSVTNLPCNEALFIRVVKAAFNQRRKMMRNSLKAVPFNHGAIMHLPIFNLRPEQLSVKGFQELTSMIQDNPSLDKGRE